MPKLIGRLLAELAFGWAGSLTLQVPITGDDRNWAHLDLFTNLSWHETNAVCPEGKM